jgi:DNA-binding transcriptional MerR regulator
VARRASVPVDPRGIPEKPYFKIGEAARLCAVKPYVLRYWETEFRSLRPEKTRSGQRLYRRRDIDLLLRIRELLYKKRYTIAGARTWLKDSGHDEKVALPEVPPPDIDRATLKKFKDGLIDLLSLVEE